MSDRFNTEPVWRLGHTLSPSLVPTEIGQWLYDAGSLTKRLRQSDTGLFRVEVLQQCWQRPMRCERRALGLNDRAVALVRQVHLYCGDQVKVYARTVLPQSILKGQQRSLARLGGRPLGEALFRDKTMRRGAIEVAMIESGQPFFEQAVPKVKRLPQRIWGRRSVFYLAGKPLLVSEVFLPPPPKTKRYRFNVKI